MRRLVLVCMVAFVSSLAGGCIISSDDDDDDDGDLGFIDASWSFSTVAGGGLGCPADFQTAKVEARGTENIDDLFDCDALQGTSAEGHIIGNYDVQIIIADIDANGVELARYGESLLFDVDLVPGDVAVDEDFLDDGGRLIVGVDLVDGGAATDCAGGGVDAIGLTGTSTTAMYLEDIACADATASTVIAPPALAETYTLSIQALDAAGNPVGQPTNIPNTVVDAPNGYTDLGVQTVDLTP
jgi:hypothetical protein